MHRPLPAVVVGIDGSRAATAAARWAVDEAVNQDIPLRLVCAVWPQPDLSCCTYELADEALSATIADVEAAGKPVRLEADVIYGRPDLVLQAQSRDAAMLCLGSTGRTHGGLGRVGSTVAAVAAATLDCPLAVIHADRPPTTPPVWVVAEVSESPAGERALRRGVEEALLRGATLRVVATWQARYTDIHDVRATVDGNRMVKAHWERLLLPWRQRYPQLDIHAAAVHGSVFNFLARHRRKIRLLVLPHARSTELAELLSPQGLPASRDIYFDVVICEPGTCRDLTISMEHSGKPGMGWQLGEVTDATL